ncbi:MAG: hypothetical protein ACK502_04060 [Alphaproteobacteria bacterium]
MQLKFVHKSILLIAAFAVLSAFKISSYMFSGRFLAEEGTFFYTHIHASGFWSGLVYVYKGHLEFFTNLVVALSTLVPLQYAPLVTTYLSLLIQAMPIMFIIFNRNAFGLSARQTFLFIFILCGSSVHEVWANSINLHFHFMLLAALILALPDAVLQKQKHLCRLLLLMSGISGVFANFLLPLFVIKWLKYRNYEYFLHALIISSTTALQLILIAIFPNTLDVMRDYSFDIILFFYTILGQELVMPIFADMFNPFLPLLQDNARALQPTALVITLLLVVLYLFLCFRICKTGSIGLMLVLSYVILSFFVFFIAAGNKSDMAISLVGGRYFFVSNALLLLGLIKAQPDDKLHLTTLIFCIMCITSIPRLYMPALGPEWSESYKKAVEESSERIQIWPSPWSMPNHTLMQRNNTY